MLIIGVFILFYVRQKRVWLAYSKQENALTIAGKDRKDLPETKIEFDQLVEIVKTNLKVS
jgi:cytochrome c biogenesis protein